MIERSEELFLKLEYILPIVLDFTTSIANTHFIWEMNFELK